ncbi:MAG TPA: translocation/assembly module TamB domain-containing protein [Candidatus Acidoferrum sp.]|nr:translocation/assembly module TamB domain-containing protein [Candidatus Acidoferrum sp.]
MTEASTKPIRRRRWKYLLIGFAAMSVTALGLLVYVNTESFQSLIRHRLVAEVERVTGGHVEIGSIHTTPFRLQVDVRDITVHGRESATQVPLAHVDRIVARLKFNFLLRSELAFSEIVLDQPIVHVAFYPDGTTNFPPRKPAAFSGQTPVEQLFALSINHFELRHGQLLWDDRHIPLDLAARDASLHMDYSFLHGRYDGHLLLGLVDTKLLDCKPFAWMGNVEFSLQSNSAVVPSIKWNSGHSHFSASGQITDLRRPHLQAQYDAQLDLAEVASIARRRDLKGGVLELKGRGDWTLEQFASNGLLTVRDLAWQDDQISFSKASLTTGYSVTDQQLKLSKLQGKIFGGSFTGDAELNQWLAPAQHLSPNAIKILDTAVISAAPPPPLKKSREKAAKPKPQAIQTTVILLHLRDLSAEELAAALNTPAHSFPRFHPAASASGTVETRWKGTPRDAEVQFTVDLTPPSRLAPAQLALSAHANGVYHVASNSLDLPQFTLTTPTSRIQASGTLSASSAVRLSISTSSLADWLPFFDVVRGPALFPVTLNGRATFNGSLSGLFSAPQLTGSLQVDDFDVALPATAKTGEFQTHWDSLSTPVQLSFNAIALRGATLRRGDTSAEFDATATLQHGHITGESAFTLRADLHNTDLAALQALAGYNYPIFGKADLSVQATGTVFDPRGDGQLHLTNASAYGETVRQFDSNFHFAQGEIAFDHMQLLHDDSAITGSAAYKPSTRAFHLDLTGTNFDLAQVQRIQSHPFSVEGRADFTLKGSGTPEAPSINADVHIRSLTLDHELAGELDLQAVTQGSELHLTGNSQFQHGSLLLSGNVQLRDGYPADVSFQLDQFDLDALWRSFLHGQLTGHSAVAGSVNLRGPLRQPEQWIIDGTLTSLALDVDNLKVHNQDPIRFSLANRSVNIQQLHVLGEGTDFTAHGSVQLSGDRALDLTADGHVDLKLLSSFDPDVTSSGLVTMNVTLGGTLANPLPQGHFQVSGGSLSYAGLPSGLSDLNGSLLFTRDRIHIETLSARTGGGTLDLKGDATYFNQQLNFNLTATGKDVRLRYPPGVSSTADSELHWIGTRTASTVSGDIRINKMAVTPGFDFSAYLERSRQFAAVTAANSPLNSVKLDIHVVTAPELQMRTALARLSGDADLRIRGSVGRPAVLGRVDILEGQATFHGTRFTLERGDITFANPVAIEPQLNLQATTHVRNYDLNITLTGTPNRGLNLNYRSEPPLPKSDIIALLALGRTNEESAQLQEQSGQSVFSDQASALILNQALNDTTSSRFQRLFGASNIKIDPQGLSTETNPTARGPQVTIEQEFANNISLTYSTNVSQSSQQIIQGEYYFNRNVSVVGTRDQNGVVSFDLRVRRRKK